MRPTNPHTIHKYGGIIGTRAIRIVWATVTKHPTASVNELRDLANLNRSTVVRALAVLRDAGYVAQHGRQARARRIVVPFAEITS